MNSHDPALSISSGVGAGAGAQQGSSGGGLLPRGLHMLHGARDGVSVSDGEGLTAAGHSLHMPPPGLLTCASALSGRQSLASSELRGGASCTSRVGTVIPDTVYFGGFREANNLRSMRKRRITAFLCVAAEAHRPSFVSAEDEEAGRVLFRKIPMRDGLGTELSQHLASAFAFLDTARRQGRVAMVYCRQGYSRSASIVIAYHMRESELDFHAALAQLRRDRHADPNLAFCTQLQAMSPAQLPPAAPMTSVAVPLELPAYLGSGHPMHRADPCLPGRRLSGAETLDVDSRRGSRAILPEAVGADSSSDSGDDTF